MYFYKLLKDGSYIVSNASECNFGKRVLLTKLKHPETKNTASLSTVFLGIDHDFSDHGPPILFETMLFSEGQEEEFCLRASSIEEIKQIHYKTCTDLLLGGYQYVSGDVDITPVKDSSKIDLF